MATWRERVRSAPDKPKPSAQLSDADLDDHLPSLVHKLSEALRSYAIPEVETEGANFRT